jgi:muramoyltetrapeptide carboxypeptidase LdcA involved in peptidoglycan recycling
MVKSHQQLVLTKPRPVPKGGTIGVFAPSSPLHNRFCTRYKAAITNLESLGYTVVVGDLTAQSDDQGYRTSTGKDRAEELNQLFQRSDVDLIMSTIGGANSSSLLPYLDYTSIGKSGKVFCGYSDVTALHMAIRSEAQLSTLYGPAVIPSFGDSEGAAKETLSSFIDQVSNGWHGEYIAPPRWSNKGPTWEEDESGPLERQWQPNGKYASAQDGKATGPSLAANLSTLVSLAGSRYFPVTAGHILFLEEMSCPLSRFERNLSQMKFAGAFDDIAGIVLSKPEFYNCEGAPFSDVDLLLEILDNSAIPVISGFDCGHTHPMFSIPQGVEFTISASKDSCSIKQVSTFTA